MTLADLNVGIAGMGLIGGSMAAALGSSGAAKQVFAWDRDPSVMETALDMGFCFQPCITREEFISSLDVLILAVPLRYMEQVSLELEPLCTEMPVAVMDVGSTKKDIGETLSAIWGGAYVGLHPMAGKEYSGVENASLDLFRNADCAIVPHKLTTPEVEQLAVQVVSAIGSRAVCMDPDEHDRILACVSHLPTVLASSLALLAGEEKQEYPNLPDMIGGGFRDTSRVASGPAWLAADMWATNHKNMDALLDRLIEILQNFKNCSPEEFEAMAEEGRLSREAILMDIAGK
jgi:prephenate dehydrogenase